MSKPFILSIDEGTTNAKAIIVDCDGVTLNKGSVPVTLTHPQPGWAEQDPLEIWQATQDAIRVCMQGFELDDLKGIAISNQRESILIWDRDSGLPLTPVVSWQCRRSTSVCETISTKPGAEQIQSRTGLVLDPLFPASKILWLLQHLEHGFERAGSGALCVGTVDAWLVWQLTGGETFVTDYANASRYQLFNIHDLAWDPMLLELFDIPLACLPEVIPSSGHRGVTRACVCLPDGVPILSQIGDSHAALYGQGGFNHGVVKATYGTGSSLMTRVDDPPSMDRGVSTTVAWHDGTPSLALEGNITHTGSAIQYMSRLLGVEEIEQLSDMAWSVEHNNGVYFVPALAGLGAPYWDAKARGMICGLTDSATPAILARAAFESVVYQIADLFFAIEAASGHPLTQLLVDGGPTKNRALMQLQADLLQVPIVRNDIAEVSALGAAYLAGKALGWWTNYQQLSSLPRLTEVIEPNPRSQHIQNNYINWKTAVQRARFQAD